MNITLHVPDGVSAPELIRGYYAHRLSKIEDQDYRERVRTSGEEFAETSQRALLLRQIFLVALLRRSEVEMIAEIFEWKFGQSDPISGDKIIELIRVLREAAQITQEQNVGPVC
jgi:hypothetical protein